MPINRKYERKSAKKYTNILKKCLISNRNLQSSCYKYILKWKLWESHNSSYTRRIDSIIFISSTIAGVYLDKSTICAPRRCGKSEVSSYGSQ